RPRPEVLADAFGLVRMDVAGVDRALGVRADDLDRRVLLLQVPAGARYRAARPDAEHEVRDLAPGLGPELGPGRLVVRGDVLLVPVLPGHVAARELFRETLGDLVVGGGILGSDRGRADDDLGAVRPEDVALLLALLVRHR